MKFLYSIRDNKAEQSAPPFVARTDGEAIRMFQQAVNDKNPENLLNKYSEDYELTKVGAWDEDGGEIDATVSTTIVTAARLREAA